MRGNKVIEIPVSLGKFSLVPWVSALLAIVLLVTLFKMMIVVPAGKRVVLFNVLVGVEHRTLGEGMHLVVPFVQTPVAYNVRTNTYTMSGRDAEGQVTGDDALECLTSDGQKIRVDMSVIYRLIPEEVWMLHREIGPDYEDKIIRPEISSIARNTFTNYTVVDIYSHKRDQVQAEIGQRLKQSLAKYHIDVDETMIRNVTFSEAFAHAIEQKQVALQDAERMRFILDKERQEKERKIIEAQGEAEAIRQKAAVLRANPLLIQYEYVNKLAPGIQTIITDQKTLMNLPSEVFRKK